MAERTGFKYQFRRPFSKAFSDLVGLIPTPIPTSLGGDIPTPMDTSFTSPTAPAPAPALAWSAGKGSQRRSSGGGTEGEFSPMSA